MARQDRSRNNGEAKHTTKFKPRDIQLLHRKRTKKKDDSSSESACRICIKGETTTGSSVSMHRPHISHPRLESLRNNDTGHSFQSSGPSEILTSIMHKEEDSVKEQKRMDQHLESKTNQNRTNTIKSEASCAVETCQKPTASRLSPGCSSEHYPRQLQQVNPLEQQQIHNRLLLHQNQIANSIRIQPTSKTTLVSDGEAFPESPVPSNHDLAPASTDGLHCQAKQPPPITGIPEKELEETDIVFLKLTVNGASFVNGSDAGEHQLLRASFQDSAEKKPEKANPSIISNKTDAFGASVDTANDSKEDKGPAGSTSSSKPSPPKSTHSCEPPIADFVNHNPAEHRILPLCCLESQETSRGDHKRDDDLNYNVPLIEPTTPKDVSPTPLPVEPGPLNSDLAVFGTNGPYGPATVGDEISPPSTPCRSSKRQRKTTYWEGMCSHDLVSDSVFAAIVNHGNDYDTISRTNKTSRHLQTPVKHTAAICSSSSRRNKQQSPKSLSERMACGLFRGVSLLDNDSSEQSIATESPQESKASSEIVDPMKVQSTTFLPREDPNLLLPEQEAIDGAPEGKIALPTVASMPVKPAKRESKPVGIGCNVEYVSQDSVTSETDVQLNAQHLSTNGEERTGQNHHKDTPGFRKYRWSKEERKQFLLGIEMFGKDASKIAAFMKTRKKKQVALRLARFRLNQSGVSITNASRLSLALSRKKRKTKKRMHYGDESSEEDASTTPRVLEPGTSEVHTSGDEVSSASHSDSWTQEAVFASHQSNLEQFHSNSDPAIPASLKRTCSYDSTSRVLMANFKGEDISQTGKRFIATMMERHDVSVIMDGLLKNSFVERTHVDRLLTAFGSAVYHKFRLFDRKTDGRGKQYFKERKRDAKMTIAEFRRYIHLVERGQSGQFEFTDSNNKLCTADAKDTAVYMIDCDLSQFLPRVNAEYKSAFRLPEFLPGGAACMMNAVCCCRNRIQLAILTLTLCILSYYTKLPENARPFMGPNMYLAAGGAFTILHQDGFGSVDSGHTNLAGYNEVVMLRRLSEREKQDAVEILGYDAKFSLPHNQDKVCPSYTRTL